MRSEDWGTEMRVVLDHSSQGANGVNVNRPLFFALMVDSMFGKWCSSTAQDVSDSRLHLPPAASWPPSPEKGRGRGGSGGVQSQLSLGK